MLGRGFDQVNAGRCRLSRRQTPSTRIPSPEILSRKLSSSKVSSPKVPSPQVTPAKAAPRQPAPARRGHTPLAAQLDAAPITIETVQDRIYRQLRAWLMEGRFHPGQRLKIQELSALFGTSSQPVREAIRQLVAERALEALPNRSARIPALTPGAIEDLRRVRMAVEGLAVEMAASRIGLADIKALAELVSAGAQADEDGDAQASVAHNQAFHLRLYELSGSSVLPPIIERLWLQVGPYLRRSAEGFDGRAGRGVVFHAALLRALRRRDAPAARRAIEQDIDRSCALLQACLRAEDRAA
jgi:DNA-binding GntR family transcriptional regulator